MQEPTRASFRGVVRTGFFSCMMLIWPVILWLALLLGIWREAEPAAEAESWRFFLTLAAAVTLVCLPGLIWRVWSISQVFAWGVEVTGQVTGIHFFRGRGRVEYAYTYLGELYHAGNAILKTAQTRPLAVGDAVVIMVDRNRPGRAYIRDIYAR